MMNGREAAFIVSVAVIFAVSKGSDTGQYREMNDMDNHGISMEIIYSGEPMIPIPPPCLYKPS
jgi:hypothetical protein